MGAVGALGDRRRSAAGPRGDVLSAATLLALLLSGSGPIVVQTLTESGAAGPVAIFVARVDLTDARVEVRVTGPVEARAEDPAGTEARLLATPEWMGREGAVLAVNANFFARLAGAPPAWTAGQPVDLIGPSVSEGRVVSPASRTAPGQPALLLTRGREASVACAVAADLEGKDDVVAGAASEGGGCLLVEAGVNKAAIAFPRATERHPRTAAGLTRDARELLLVVVDGRQPGWSVGMTLPELGELMLRLGAHGAVNLDGGGSSSFLYRPPGGPEVTNRPSDGTWRPVANHLGVVLREPPR